MKFLSNLYVGKYYFATNLATPTHHVTYGRTGKPVCNDRNISAGSIKRGLYPKYLQSLEPADLNSIDSNRARFIIEKFNRNNLADVELSQDEVALIISALYANSENVCTNCMKVIEEKYYFEINLDSSIYHVIDKSTNKLVCTSRNVIKEASSRKNFSDNSPGIHLESLEPRDLYRAFNSVSFDEVFNRVNNLIQYSIKEKFTDVLLSQNGVAVTASALKADGENVCGNCMKGIYGNNLE